MLFSAFNNEFKSQSHFQKEVISGMLISLFGKLKSEFSHTKHSAVKPDRKQQILNEFLVLVESNFHKIKKVADYASIMNISAKHLSETVKSVSNVTALAHIHNRIVREAEFILILLPP